MATVAPTAAMWTWPPDVKAFAAQQGVSDYLEPMLEVTRRVFPNAQRTAVYLEDDWEIPDVRTIVFHVLEAGLSSDQYVEARHRYLEASFEICPAPLICLFGLRLEIVDA